LGYFTRQGRRRRTSGPLGLCEVRPEKYIN